AGPPGGLRGLLHVAPHGRRVRRGVQGHLRVLGPDPDPDLSSQRPPRRSGTRTRVISAAAAVAYVALSSAAVALFPPSSLLLRSSQGSVLSASVAQVPRWLRAILLSAALLVLMPLIGTYNGYYLEVATQVGIFVALALGLNIVVGLAGLLDLGYVAFFAV